MAIVGIVDDIKEAPLDSETPPTIYVPFAQDPTSGFSVFVRTSQAERSVLTGDQRRDSRDRSSACRLWRVCDAGVGQRFAVGLPAAFVGRAGERLCRRWRGCSGSWASTAWWRIRSASARARSACAWRSAHTARHLPAGAAGGRLADGRGRRCSVLVCAVGSGDAHARSCCSAFESWDLPTLVDCRAPCSVFLRLAPATCRRDAQHL